jgi:hypothetical protein
VISSATCGLSLQRDSDNGVKVPVPRVFSHGGQMEFAFTPSHTYNMAIGGELARKNNMASRAKLAIVAIELEIEDMGIVVILEKKI